MNNLLVNPKYEALRSYLESIPERMLYEGTTLYQKRNLIKELVTPDGLHINVKRYHKPFIINAIVYSTGIRKPKGQRAYEYPLILANKGINTPEPIAYIEERKMGLLQFSYFISIQAQGYKTLYEVGNAKEGTYEALAGALGVFTAEMHKKEVLHKDYSPGNILYKVEHDNYLFTIVDINRMQFGPVDQRTGCQNFARLWGPKRFIILMVEAYARHRGFNVETCVEVALEERRRFWRNYQKKHSVGFDLEL
ncbi:MAG: aminoglycoside phosphotransferase [Bacteroidaceae bacterium]|nr:aminoglycoside phosphotransferase [Bacteroidaceae bacterium]